MNAPESISYMAAVVAGGCHSSILFRLHMDTKNVTSSEMGATPSKTAHSLSSDFAQINRKLIVQIG